MMPFRPKKSPGACREEPCRFPPTHVEVHEQEHMRTHALSDITWRIFRIMAEFVDGFEFLSKSSREITVFGSARLKQKTHWCEEAEAFGTLAAKGGFTIITGGGPGIMEAANKGAFEAGGHSIGLNIELPLEQRANGYLTRGKGFHYFFTRKVMLSASAQAYVFFPGGFGTLDELFEMLVLIQTKKAQRVPVVVIGHAFWTPLLEWLKRTAVEEYKTITPEDFRLIILVDTAEEAWELVKNSKEREIF